MKRLEAIESLEELGSGFALATHDLEIRGAGELLGEGQSGQIQAIGFTLYNELLGRAVAALRDGHEPDLEDPFTHGPEIEIGVPALIPEDYMPDVHMRLVHYKRIANCRTRTPSSTGCKVELIDRFGLLPPPLKTLFSITALKLLAQQLGDREDPSGGRRRQHDASQSERSVDPARLSQLIEGDPERYRLDGPYKLRFSWRVEAPSKRIAALEKLLKRLGAEGPRIRGRMKRRRAILARMVARKSRLACSPRRSRVSRSAALRRPAARSRRTCRRRRSRRRKPCPRRRCPRRRCTRAPAISGRGADLRAPRVRSQRGAVHDRERPLVAARRRARCATPPVFDDTNFGPLAQNPPPAGQPARSVPTRRRPAATRSPRRQRVPLPAVAARGAPAQRRSTACSRGTRRLRAAAARRLGAAGTARDDARPFDLAMLGATNPMGSIRLYLSRFLHVNARPELPGSRGAPPRRPPRRRSATSSPSCRLRRAIVSRRTGHARSGELHYFDHPAFGVLIKVTPVRPEQTPPGAPGTRPAA